MTIQFCTVVIPARRKSAIIRRKLRCASRGEMRFGQFIDSPNLERGDSNRGIGGAARRAACPLCANSGHLYVRNGLRKSLRFTVSSVLTLGGSVYQFAEAATK
jgi:hypothetical protein